MKEGSFGLRCALIVLVLGMAPTAAMAYIDPGNGAYMVQVLFTLAGAALFYVRHPIRSLKALWNSLARRRKNDDALQQDETSVQRNAAGSEVVTGAGGNSSQT